MKTSIFAITAAMAVGLSGMAWAETANGVITRVSRAEETLSLGNKMTFHVPEKVDVSPLAVGEKVTVDYSPSGDRKILNSFAVLGQGGNTAIGKITEVNAATGTLALGPDMVFRIPAGTDSTDTQQVDVSTLRVGDNVQVTYDMNGTDKIANSVEPLS